MEYTPYIQFRIGEGGEGGTIPYHGMSGVVQVGSIGVEALLRARAGMSAVVDETSVIVLDCVG